MSLHPGHHLGNYEILAPIGKGGMGEVYRARDRKLGRDVALKVLPSDLAADKERLGRFEREARSASALNHPSVVHIYDVGEEEGLHFIAMELISGRTVRALLADGPLSVDDLLKVGSQVAEGLARAHDKGIVHRDLKPENLMVTDDGWVKILDFGLAKLAATETMDVADAQTIAPLATRPGTIMGTVEYMAPEQATGRPVDHRSDQFAFGSILYELASGEFAFRSESMPQTLAAIIEKDPRPLSELRPDLPATFQTVVRRCLAKEPADRYRTTTALARALADCKSGPQTAEVVLSELPAPAAAPAPVAAPQAVAPAGRPGVYFLQGRGDKVTEVDDGLLRKRLQGGQLHGSELIRHDGAAEWQPLYTLPVYRECVPHTGDPQDVLRVRRLKRFGLGVFGIAALAITGAFSENIIGGVFSNVWPGLVALWAVFVGVYMLGILPGTLLLARNWIRSLRAPPPPLPAPSPAHAVAAAPAATSSPASPAASPQSPAPRVPLPPRLAAEVERVRDLLRRRGGADQKTHLAEVGRLEQVMVNLVGKQADLAEQTTEQETADLRRREEKTAAKLDAAELKQDRLLYQRQLEVLRQRLDSIDKATRLLERIEVRLDLAEQQLKQLRLDLTRAEATVIDAPQLSSRLQYIRHEVDADEQVDEIFQRDS